METIKYARYTSPRIEGQKVLYKGRRYWVIEMDKNLPFELCEDICDAVVYDKVYGAAVARAQENAKPAYDPFRAPAIVPMGNNGLTPGNSGMNCTPDGRGGYNCR